MALNTCLIITGTFLIMGSAVTSQDERLHSKPQSFILSNIQAQNILRGFLLHARDTSEEEKIKYTLDISLSLFDFTSSDNVSDWTEQSDTVRTVGKSKAVFVMQETQEFRRAILFTLLNPQSNGAAFAGVRIETVMNFVGLSTIHINCRAQGNSTGYKIVLRHDGENSEPYPTYEQFFEAPMSSEVFSTVSLPLANFTAYYRGKAVPNAKPLDITNITSFGLQVYGGVYGAIHQSGVSSLEVNTIDVSS